MLPHLWGFVRAASPPGTSFADCSPPNDSTVLQEAFPDPHVPWLLSKLLQQQPVFALCHSAWWVTDCLWTYPPFKAARPQGLCGPAVQYVCLPWSSLHVINISVNRWCFPKTVRFSGKSLKYNVLFLCSCCPCWPSSVKKSCPSAPCVEDFTFLSS